MQTVKKMENIPETKKKFKFPTKVKNKQFLLIFIKKTKEVVSTLGSTKKSKFRTLPNI